ncbi:hypothetical protein BEL04_16655 [Mucilaginibacter sp. PPCGB 2223]|uniref:hypothetical protein n=1 Tax=Mucilaginibacter sp. PPCGB 2223 TaxID=1886027 RepID=UPI000825FE5B|nr:hypothetical protein [Mucilaginibacter sp. PPCGB 2223]OCX51650.1 hypothetical protein BEL04_16655 [Mucilaginibacter sp. PPCGB 2223]
MKLTAGQIAHIKAFISKRGFTYPDVQLEIIDHVASRVEELMTANPALSLDEAIQITHGEFGVMGFGVIEDAITAGLQKRYLRLFGAAFVSYFRLKYIPLMVLFICLVYIPFVAVAKPELFFIAGFILVIAALIALRYTDYKKYKRYNQLLTMKMGNLYLIFAMLIFQVWNVFGVQIRIYEHLSLNLVGIIYGLLVVVVIVLFVTINTVRKKALQSCIELDKKYHLLEPVTIAA